MVYVSPMMTVQKINISSASKDTVCVSRDTILLKLHAVSIRWSLSLQWLFIVVCMYEAKKKKYCCFRLPDAAQFFGLRLTILMAYEKEKKKI